MRSSPGDQATLSMWPGPFTASFVRRAPVGVIVQSWLPEETQAISFPWWDHDRAGPGRARAERVRRVAVSRMLHARSRRVITSRRASGAQLGEAPVARDDVAASTPGACARQHPPVVVEGEGHRPLGAKAG